MTHYSQPVASPYLADIGLAIAATQQLDGEIDEFRGIIHARHSAIAVEVGAYAHMVDAHDVDGMLKMADGIEDGRLATGFKESMIEGGVSHTASLGERSQLVVGKVARMIAERSAVGVGTDDRSLANLQGIIETLFGSMAEVDHHAEAIHLVNNLFAKLRHTIMGVVASGRIADVIVAIMAKGDIGYATLDEMLKVGDIILNSQTILYAEHDALFACLFVEQYLVRGTSKGEVLRLLVDKALDGVEDEIGVSLRRIDVEVHLMGKILW